MEDSIKGLMEYTGGTGYDDAFVYAPVRPIVEDADKVLAKDGCMNFFAGPSNTAFSAEINFYNIHYTPTHIMGSTGGNADDMIESLEMSSKGLINPAVMLTHVGGINSAIDTILDLPNIPGGKKIAYNEIDMPMTAIEDFAELGKTDPFFKELAGNWWKSIMDCGMLKRKNTCCKRERKEVKMIERIYVLNNEEGEN